MPGRRLRLVEPQEEQRRLAGGAGIAIRRMVVHTAGHHCKVAVVGRGAAGCDVQLQDLRPADDVAHVDIVPVGEFPQDLVVAGATGKGGRVGHVERIDTLTTTACAAHQHGAPVRRTGGTQVGLVHHRRGIDVASVRVCRRGQLLQIRNHPARDVGKQLGTRVGIEGMEHAVVGADVEGRHAAQVRAVEARVGGTADRLRGLRHVGDARVHDVTQLAAALAECASGSAARFQRTVTAQVVQAILTVHVGRFGRGEQRGLDRGINRRPGEDAAVEHRRRCRRVVADIDVATAGRHVIELATRTDRLARGVRPARGGGRADHDLRAVR